LPNAQQPAAGERQPAAHLLQQSYSTALQWYEQPLHAPDPP
jgi:hypothetical protein